MLVEVHTQDSLEFKTGAQFSLGAEKKLSTKHDTSLGEHTVR